MKKRLIAFKTQMIILFNNKKICLIMYCSKKNRKQFKKNKKIITIIMN